MTHSLDETHSPQLECWVESAHESATEFPIQNLPLAVFRRADVRDAPRVGVAIGDQVLDIASATRAGLLDGEVALAADACLQPDLNALMALGPRQHALLRRRLSRLLRKDNADYVRDPGLLRAQLIPMGDVDLCVPARVGDYTDFYASIHHAVNLGSMFRPDNPLLPNYKYVPVAYHGRCSSIVVSGSPVCRPNGQTTTPGASTPEFGPAKNLDYELEVGFFVGAGNRRGHPVPIDTAEEHIFGFCLVNDWSARDIQRWEYQPLGPFLGKNFCTTVSPWVVTLEALQPFRTPAFLRGAGDPAPLPYLSSKENRELGAVDLELEVWLVSSRMRDMGLPPMRLSRSNYREMYWTAAQMLTHHASNGCNLRPGDLIASGTVSGAARESFGSLMELTAAGREPLVLPSGERRAFLENGDEVILRGRCARDGFVSIGFGECRGTVVAGQACP